jgi:hypothetical protein
MSAQSPAGRGSATVFSMRTHLFLMMAAALAVTPSVGSAEERAEEDWRFEAKTPEEAVRVQANTIYPTLLTELRMSYLDFDAGGSSAGLELDVTIPNPYVFVPGVRFAKMYTLLRIEVPTATVDVPMMERKTGISDIHAIYATLRYWNRITVGGGIATLMPSATDELLGTGKLSVGPIGGISARLGVKRQTEASLILENLTSVAGPDVRADVNVLIVQPTITQYLPYAT